MSFISWFTFGWDLLLIRFSSHLNVSSVFNVMAFGNFCFRYNLNVMHNSKFVKCHQFHLFSLTSLLNCNMSPTSVSRFNNRRVEVHSNVHEDNLQLRFPNLNITAVMSPPHLLLHLYERFITTDNDFSSTWSVEILQEYVKRRRSKSFVKFPLVDCLASVNRVIWIDNLILYTLWPLLSTSEGLKTSNDFWKLTIR